MFMLLFLPKVKVVLAYPKMANATDSLKTNLSWKHDS